MGEMPIAFDWWRCGGRIIKAPAIPPPPWIQQAQINLQQRPFSSSCPQTCPMTSSSSCPSHPGTYPETDHYEMNWPMHTHQEEPHDFAPSLGHQDPFDMSCQVSRDYWHQPYKMKKCSKLCHEGPRPAWCPAKIPTDCSGVISYPPPYARYCRNRDKLSCR